MFYMQKVKETRIGKPPNPKEALAKRKEADVEKTSSAGSAPIDRVQNTMPLPTNKNELNRLLLYNAAARNIGNVQRLLKSGADVNARDNLGWTPLIWAACSGNARLVELLIDADADLNATSNGGWTPLMWAARNGHEEVIELLRKHGAKVRS